jgi:hypothetical protein
MTDPTTPTKERWLGPGVAGIGTASFLADVGHEIPTALLPNLLTATLGAPAAAALGLIGGAGAPTAAAAGPTGPDRTPGPADGRGVGVRVRECGRTLLTLRASELLNAS